ncbi:hypothetical protein JCM10207_007966 [Rhodosporidiobolus poonsookiae]
MDRLQALAAFATSRPFAAVFRLQLLGLLAILLYVLYRVFLLPALSSLRPVPGPKPAHLIWGNMEEVLEAEPGKMHQAWMDEHGGAVRYRYLFGENRLLLTDPAALNHLLNVKCYDFGKPEGMRADIHMLLGGGIAHTEGEAHRRQRRLMAPAFTPTALKALLPIFYDVAHQLRGIWQKRVANGAVEISAWPSKAAALAHAEKGVKGMAVIEVADGVTRLALDSIGKAGFNYDFDNLEMQTKPLAQAFGTLFSPPMPTGKGHPSAILLSRAALYVVRFLWRNNILRYLSPAGETAIRTLAEESRQVIDAKILKVDEEGTVKRDLISIFHSHRTQDAMTPEELRATLLTFVFAGHDTGAASLSWILWELSRHPEKQDRLREEIRTARREALNEGREELEADELNALPYLDAVVREILRLEPVNIAIPRIALHDDLLPLSTPIPSATEPGKFLSHVPVKKGQLIEIGIFAANRNKAVFGEDVDEFRPERWLDDDNKIESKVGVWSGLMSFVHGPRACIGYKFAIYELKAVISVLIDDFDFRPRDPDMQIVHRHQMVVKPLVVGEKHLGPRMPLQVRMAKREEE